METKKGSNISVEAFCTQGGNRTRTPRNWILNPARLPIPPLEQVFGNKTAKL